MSQLLLINGKIYTMDAHSPYCEAVAVQDGQIIDTGDTAQMVAKYRTATTKVIDLQQRMVTPGLIDSHMHLVAHGIRLRSLDFSECRDALEMKRMIEQKIAQTPKGEWIIGRGWNENNFPDLKIFTKDELDRMTSEHPVFLTRICGHAFLANSLALQYAGVDEQTLDPAGGKIVRDENQRITGLLLEHAGLLVQEHIPEDTYEELKDSLTLAIQDCWRLGLTGCHTEDLRYCGGFGQTYRLFQEVIEEEGYLFRTQQLVYHDYINEMLEHGHRYGSGTPFVKVGGVKIFADGAMGGRSALLKKPYHDDPTTNGVAIHRPDELKKIVHRARVHQLPIAVHTIGDLALEYTLDAIEAFPTPDGTLDRIIHAQVLNPELLERLTKLPLSMDIQPRFVAADFPWVIDRLGEERIRWSYAWKTMIKAGLHCAGGSDAPIEPVDPLLGLQAAVTRVRPDEQPHDLYMPEQRLSTQEALELFTLGSAYAEQQIDRKGSISIGKIADFTVYEQDLFELAPYEWLNNKVQMTIIDGRIVYED